MEQELEGSISIRIFAKRKNTFKVSCRQEIKIDEASFRVRHEARISSSESLSNKSMDSREFKNIISNMMMPFAAELFSTLTGKSFPVPIISPGELPEETEALE